MNETKFKETEIGMIPEDWEVKEIQGVISKLGDGLHGTPHYCDDGKYYFVNGNNLVDGRVEINDKTKRCSEEEFEKYKKELNERTILVSINGTIGNIAVYKNEKIILGKSACYLNVKKDVELSFIRYVLKNPYFQNYIQSNATGTTIKNVSLRQMREFKFGIPPLVQEQRAISKILSDLDAKIELNSQMNQTLEQIGESLFKRWFIDFEFPDDEGKPYKSAGGTMVESELGEIPKGWVVKSIDYVADFLNGLAMQKYPAESGEDYLPVIKIRELKQGITESSDKANMTVPSNYIVTDGDVLFSWSGSLEVVIWAYGKGALNQHLFKVSSNNYPKWFYYYWVLHYLPEYRHIAEGKATTMGHIQRHHLKSSLIPLPNNETLIKMDKILRPVMDRIVGIKVESRNLSKIRDSLLPKLMSGEIRIGFEAKV